MSGNHRVPHAETEEEVLEAAGLTGKEHPDKNDIIGVALQLTGQNVTTRVNYLKDLEFSNYEKRTRWWADWDRKTYKDHVVPKRESPFAPLWTDRHPAVKRR